MMVVNEVKKIGSNRDRPASRIASSIERPERRLRLILSISTIELFTTIPKSATSPMSEGNDSVEPVRASPKKTPMSERGIGARMRSACL